MRPTTPPYSIHEQYAGTRNAHRPPVFDFVRMGVVPDPAHQSLRRPFSHEGIGHHHAALRPRPQGWERILREDFEDRDRNRWWRGLPQNGGP